MNKEWTVTVEKNISDSDIWSLLVGAFEGGSNYWISHMKVHTAWVKNEKFDWSGIEEAGELATLRENKEYQYASQLPVLDPDARISIYTDSISSPAGVLTMQTIGQGLDVMARDCPRHFNDFVNERYDSFTSDVFLQCCLFDKVVYG